MAQKVEILFVDDLDGSQAEGTIDFALDGTRYEIDLNAVHARELRAALARYTKAGRKVTGGPRRPARHRAKAAANGHNTTEIRDWAKGRGYQVKDRGRIPAGVVADYEAATGE